ncbi:hypothetical protein DPMN_029348 [Dreissena polymorpha]|uniref:Uncharacterized protein n=1 Tax=Dreissena polymorpha TaxID=45954 RepID=A0A9D4LX12_DREPO|nr:hypothetical protein DPMN_029348 [Dreissena polymorpha]
MKNFKSYPRIQKSVTDRQTDRQKDRQTDRQTECANHKSHSVSPLEDKKEKDIIRTNLLTKFHEDRKINVASIVLTRINAPPPDSHDFQPTGIIFELVQHIIGMNLLTKFHVNVASRQTIIFELIQDIIETNLLTKFHEDWTINVASRVKHAPPPGGHDFKATKTIFELIQDIIGTNLLTKFHDDRKINVTSRVLTRKKMKNAPPLGSHVFQANVTIFELIQDINKTNLLTKIHEDWTINVASRVLTSLITKNAPPPGGHVFKETKTIFELIHDIIGTNLLTKFHKDGKINVASRELTRKNASPPGGNVFQPTGIIFELVQYIIGMNLLTKFHKDWTINVASRVKNAPPLGSDVFQAKVTIFELIQDIIGTNLLTKFHEDWKINVASRVLTRFYYSHIWKNAPHPGGHVFQPTGIIFELVQDIIGMNLLTKFHEDQTINVASRVENARPLGSHVFQANVTIFEIIQDIIDTNLLTKFHEDWTHNKCGL